MLRFQMIGEGGVESLKKLNYMITFGYKILFLLVGPIFEGILVKSAPFCVNSAPFFLTENVSNLHLFVSNLHLFSFKKS